MEIRKEDFEVFDKHLNNDGGAYKRLKWFSNKWYNHEMYVAAKNNES